MSDSVVRRFVPPGGAAEWATVTPIVLHGHDDRRPDKREKLLRAAIRQAGFSTEIAANAECEVRPVAFWPGCDLASRYRLPRHLDGYARHHVRIRWRDSAGRPLRVPGPLCLGLGRFLGFGLFAACEARTPK
jgi:CRISPR-associated protein Csb2